MAEFLVQTIARNREGDLTRPFAFDCGYADLDALTEALQRGVVVMGERVLDVRQTQQRVPMALGAAGIVSILPLDRPARRVA